MTVARTPDHVGTATRAPRHGESGKIRSKVRCVFDALPNCHERAVSALGNQFCNLLFDLAQACHQFRSEPGKSPQTQWTFDKPRLQPTPALIADWR